MAITIHATAFPMMMRFLSLRSGGDLSCGTSARLCRRSAIMGASPEAFREADGSRIAAVSVFFRSLATIGRLARLDHSLSPGCGGIAWLSMNNLVQDNDVTAICCPCSDAACSVECLNVENRTVDFVPRFLIMHSSIESRADH